MSETGKRLKLRGKKNKRRGDRHMKERKTSIGMTGTGKRLKHTSIGET
jgi:hypothetical protein